ncbi:neurofilament medium polypeptide-like [Panicum virgatum]|uniref:neurofilament medium polypeptide-like n=1 Tax=Panicum virgatum TaxID=38727 RepID=UPI0019D68CB0|nr:neurofilament medium polypeptide-like [Panicum virgatum]
MPDAAAADAPVPGTATPDAAAADVPVPGAATPDAAAAEAPVPGAATPDAVTPEASATATVAPTPDLASVSAAATRAATASTTVPEVPTPVPDVPSPSAQPAAEEELEEVFGSRLLQGPPKEEVAPLPQELDKLSETLQGWREQLQEAASKQAVAELELEEDRKSLARRESLTTNMELQLERQRESIKKLKESAAKKKAEFEERTRELDCGLILTKVRGSYAKTPGRRGTRRSWPLDHDPVVRSNRYAGSNPGRPTKIGRLWMDEAWAAARGNAGDVSRGGARQNSPEFSDFEASGVGSGWGLAWDDHRDMRDPPKAFAGRGEGRSGGFDGGGGSAVTEFVGTRCLGA